MHGCKIHSTVVVHLSCLLQHTVIHAGLFTDLTVILGFEYGSYNIGEGMGSIQVCIQVKDGVPQSLLHLSLTTVDGNATGNHCSTLAMNFPSIKHTLV